MPDSKRTGPIGLPTMALGAHGGSSMARPQRERPKPWAETSRQGLTRYLWRFEAKRYWTSFYEDPQEALADAVGQIAEQLAGTWQDKAGPKTLVEEWIDEWRELLPDDLAKKTQIKYRYFIEDFILPQFEGRELGSLAFGEIERWEKAIKKRISARGTPYAPSVASGARSLLITILGDAVHAGKIKTNPAERRKCRRGKVKAKGRRGPSYAATQTPKNNVLTPLQATCLAERCALMSGRDIDFVMNVFAAWTGVRWGELMAVEGSEDKDSPLQLPDSGIGTYALDWQLLDVGGEVSKAPPKDGSYRVLDIPPFLVALLHWAVKNRLPSCSCPPLDDGRPACKGGNPEDKDHYDPTPASYLFLGPRGGHPRRSNYADDILTPAAEGLHPARNGSRRPVYVKAEPWPGIPVRKGNRRYRAADLADGTWPNLTGHVKPHDYRHTHSTILERRGVASDATFRRSREEGAVRDAGARAPMAI
jgi:integrase